MRLSNQTGSLFHMFFMNCTMTPLNNPQVRLALKLACNRKQILASANAGFGTIANDLLGVNFADSAKLPQRKYDPAMAKQLLQQANATGAPFVITCLSDFPGSLETATVYVQQLTNLGLNATVNPVPTATFFADISGSAHKSMIACLPITDRDWPVSAATYLMPNSIRNFSFWASPQWAKEFTKTRRTVNPAARKKQDIALQKQVWATGGILSPCSSPNINASDRNFVGMDDVGFLWALYPGFASARFT